MQVSSSDSAPGGEWEIGPPSRVVPGRRAAIIGFRDRRESGLELRVADIPAVTVVIEFGGSGLTVEGAGGRRELTAFVAGCASGAMRIGGARPAWVEARLSPVQAYSLLGVAPGELSGAVVDLTELWGPRAELLRERLAAAATWERRFALTEDFLTARADPARAVDPEVAVSWRRIVTGRGQVRIDELAEACGWSRKRLWARFHAQIGLTPKRAAMLVRFRHAVDGLVAGGSAADIAACCGYTDQSHLGRDMSSFIGVTPATLTREMLNPFSRRRHQAWGTFFLDRAEPAVR
ncbi:helix-turn-helix domain-containing protein [Nocardia grenadensis]|uniref:helix-turn-helix domain-containing protein n=1 Tax=Nocardia grenadensis TaxID=931537 RepID=UPI003D9171C8